MFNFILQFNTDLLWGDKYGLNEHSDISLSIFKFLLCSNSLIRLK
jgi:hypothetical protein